MALGGDLNISLDNGFTPAVGDRFELLTADGGITGTFDTATLPDIPGNLEFGLFYTPTSVIMETRIEQNTIDLPGDYNRDSVVDAADYLVWRDRLGNTASLANDDTPGVGQDDYDRWRANFGRAGELITAAALGSHSAVPEPASALIAFVAVLALALRRVGTAHLRSSFG
jgi:hypothetical protein